MLFQRPVLFPSFDAKVSHLKYLIYSSLFDFCVI